MDPLSVTAGVVGILDSVTRINSAIAAFRNDYKVADEDLNFARKHALLLREEIEGLDSVTLPPYTPPSKSDKNRHPQHGANDDTGMDRASFVLAMATARDLLSSIEEAFPLRSEPHTWKSKVRWAIKDKSVLEGLKEKLKAAESTLQGVVAAEQLYVLPCTPLDVASNTY